MTERSLSILEAGEAFRTRALTPLALTRAFLSRIARRDPQLHCFTELLAAPALAAAERATEELAAGRDRGPLHGIPYALVDVIDVAGRRTSCLSRLTQAHIATEDAAVVERLTAAGAILLGKLWTFEFATAPPAADAEFAPACNPWDVARGTGASAAGAAVAADLVPLAIGLDTGGAVRAGAALCGAVGLKPSFGRVSRRGVRLLAPTLDHIGVITRNVRDLVPVLALLDGGDAADASSRALPPIAAEGALARGARGLTIGLLAGWWREPARFDPDMAQSLERAARLFTDIGASVREVEIPPLDLFAAVANSIYLREAYARHERDLRDRPGLYGEAARERLLTGAFVAALDYDRAQRLSERLRRQLDEGAFALCDLLLAPVTAAPAPLLAEQGYGTLRGAGGTTIPFNLMGHPALGLCSASSPAGLPLGMQLVGRFGAEATLIGAAAAFEAAAGFSRREIP